MLNAKAALAWLEDAIPNPDLRGRQSGGGHNSKRTGPCTRRPQGHRSFLLGKTSAGVTHSGRALDWSLRYSSDSQPSNPCFLVPIPWTNISLETAPRENIPVVTGAAEHLVWQFFEVSVPSHHSLLRTDEPVPRLFTADGYGELGQKHPA